MLKYLALVACCAMAATPIALADEGNPTPVPESTPPTPSCDTAKVIIDHLRLSRWHRDHPLRGTRWCGDDRRAVKRARERFGEYQLYRAVTNYRGPGHGPRSPADGRWWAIPYYPIVCGESHGNFYVNDDGAYQIIPGTWAAHTPTRHEERRLERSYRVHLSFAGLAGESGELEQHIVAARAWLAGEPWYGRC